MEERDDRQEHDPVPEEIKERPSASKGWWGWVVAAGGFILLKLKTVLALLKGVFIIFKFGKFLTTGLSMLLMIVSYTYIYGWKYALGIVVLLFVHELGHLYCARRLGLATSLPLFIPFVGALIQMKEEPKDAKTEAIIGIGGPLLGVVGAFTCLLAARQFSSPLFYALAYFGFVITIFNLIPAHPLDGGRIVGAISPAIWLVGIPMIIGLSLYFFNPIAILISLLAIGKAWKVWKDRDNPYYQTDTKFRALIGLSYFTLFVLSAYYSYNLHQILDRFKLLLS
jgi:Zn-dependent protease